MVKATSKWLSNYWINRINKTSISYLNRLVTMVKIWISSTLVQILVLVINYNRTSLQVPTLIKPVNKITMTSSVRLTRMIRAYAATCSITTSLRQMGIALQRMATMEPMVINSWSKKSSSNSRPMCRTVPHKGSRCWIMDSWLHWLQVLVPQCSTVQTTTWVDPHRSWSPTLESSWTEAWTYLREVWLHDQ